MRFALHRFFSQIVQNARSSPIAQIQWAALTLMAGMALEYGLSFLKSLVIARYYGTSGEFDAYVLSLTPYLFIFGMISGVIRATMIPRYLQWRENHGVDAATDTLASCTTWLVAILLSIGTALWISSPVIASYLGKGFTAPQIELTASLLKISTGVLFLMVLNDLGLSLLQAHHRFFFSAIVPFIGGIVSLGYILQFKQQGIFSLLWGIIVGVIAEIVLTIAGLRSLFPKRMPAFTLFGAEIWATGRAMTPLLLSASLGHLNTTVDQMMASTLSTGSISSLHYAIRLHSISTQMFIMVTSKAVFPFFAKQVAAHEFALLKKTVLLTIARLLLVVCPVVLLIVFRGEWIVRHLFERGAFSAESTTATANAWIAYTIGLPMQAVGIVIVRIYNAFQRNTILTWVSGAGVGLNILFNLIFMSYWGHVGIAFSTSVVYAIMVIVLAYLLSRNVWPAETTTEGQS